MRTQSELKELYRQEMTEYWKSQRMIEYCMKKVAYIVELNDGNYYTIDKPSIETRFCFGHGYCGVTTQEDERQAFDMAEYASTNADYFMKKNLEGIERQIEQLQDTSLYGYTFTGYSAMNPDAHYRSYNIVELYDNPEYAPYKWNALKNLNVLTDSERQAIIEGLEEVKKAFVKRLNTYLKRYGMSKVRTWTYLVD